MYTTFTVTKVAFATALLITGGELLAKPYGNKELIRSRIEITESRFTYKTADACIDLHISERADRLRFISQVKRAKGKWVLVHFTKMRTSEMLSFLPAGVIIVDGVENVSSSPGYRQSGVKMFTSCEINGPPQYDAKIYRITWWKFR